MIGTFQTQFLTCEPKKEKMENNIIFFFFTVGSGLKIYYKFLFVDELIMFPDNFNFKSFEIECSYAVSQFSIFKTFEAKNKIKVLVVPNKVG